MRDTKTHEIQTEKSLKMLIVSQYYVPDITAAAFRLKETADLLSRKNHDVTVVTAEPHKSKSVEPGATHNKENNVIRTPIFKYKGGGKVNYIAHYASFMVNAIIAGVFRTGRQDVVLASSPPLFVGISGYLLARFKAAKFVFDVRDIWPDSAVSAGQISADSLLFRLAKKVERWLYRKADLITCVAEPMADYIRFHAGHDRLLVIYNGVPASYCQSGNSDDSRLTKMMNPEYFNVVYVGNMGHCQDAGLAVRAAASLKTGGRNQKTRFFLIGDGVERSGLEKIVAESGLDNVIIDGPVNKLEAFDVMRKASALFLQLKPDITLEKTIPSKVFDYMVAGKPVIYGLEGEGRIILEKSKGNLYFEPGSLAGFLECLESLDMRYSEFSANARKNRLLVEQHYTRETMVDKLEASLQRLTS